VGLSLISLTNDVCQNMRHYIYNL